jgi:hypothetical protein
MRHHRANAPLLTFFLHAGLVCCGVIAFGSPALAQPPQSGFPLPRLFVVSPCGGKQGSTFEVTFAGQDVEDPEALLFSHAGIKAQPIIPPPPPQPKPDPNKKPDPKKPAPPAKPAPRPPVTQFRVSIAPNTPVGIYDVRLVNKWGVSNARAFVVGDLKEVTEKEPNDDVPQAQRIELESTINGVIASPTDVDYYVFAGKKGQHVLVTCLASTIDSRLFAGLGLYDRAGHQLAINRHFRDKDAQLDYTLPADGDYYIRVSEFTHTEGSGEHFYRLNVSTGPWIDAILPLAVVPGQTTSLTVYGRNLPGGQPDPTMVENGQVLEKLPVLVNVPFNPAPHQPLSYSGHVPPAAAALDGMEYRLRNPAGTSNPFFLAFARAPVVVETGSHDRPEKAQEVTLPCEISGQIEKLHNRDWYVFQAQKNAVYHIELFSDRIGSHTDMYFVLRRADNKQELANLDDNPEVLTNVRFFDRNDDPPPFRFVVPEGGKYQLLVSSRDADSSAGPRHYYRVRIAPEQPDFHLFVMPSDGLRPDSCCLRQGGRESFTVLVHREEGWNGAVTVTADGLPPGVTCPPQLIAPGIRQTSLVLSASPQAPVWTGEIKVQGAGTVNGHQVTHEARPANVTWPLSQPQGIPAVTRLERNVVLAVREKAPFQISAVPEKSFAIQGSKVKVDLQAARLWPDFKAALNVVSVEPEMEFPPNLTFNNNQPVTIAADKKEAKAELDIQANVQPGTYNLALWGTAQIPYNKDPMAKDKPNINLVLPATPFTFTVLPRQVANLSVNNANPALQAGKQTELVVQVARLNDFAGEFKVQLVLPANMKGVAADMVTIPPSKNDAKLVLKAPADAAPGNRAGILVRASATVHPEVVLNQDVPINVNVVK